MEENKKKGNKSREKAKRRSFFSKAIAGVGVFAIAAVAAVGLTGCNRDEVECDLENCECEVCECEDCSGGE
ncbi:MAG: hypothetical protein FWE38_03505 [Firmicutes bacterium]|nr:hypothetical protein [Bacillota bacterium]